MNWVPFFGGDSQDGFDWLSGSLYGKSAETAGTLYGATQTVEPEKKEEKSTGLWSSWW